MVDLSRQRMTVETLNHLLRLARARDIKAFITRLAWGGNTQDISVLQTSLRDEEADEGAGRIAEPSKLIPSYHLSLRAPKGSEMFLEDGTNAVTSVHREWDKMQRLSESLRRGQLPGVTGQMITDVLVVGQGTSIMALQFSYSALCRDEQATSGRKMGMTGRKGVGYRRLRFVTSVDPVRVASIVADLDATATLVVTIATTGREEIVKATGLLQSWLFKSLGVFDGRRPVDQILSKHMIFITANERLAIERRPETVFVLPGHSQCEPFTSMTATTLLPLSIVFGWSIVEQYIQGAHDLDSHFVESNPRHNLPVLLALADVWNESCLQTSGRVVTPFSEALTDFPAFCAAIESQACGNTSGTMAPVGLQVINGGLHSVYDRSLYQSNKLLSTELVTMLDPQLAFNTGDLADKQDIYSAQDTLLCSVFAHADEMAFGSSVADVRGNLAPNMTTGPPLSASEATPNTIENASEGNRASTLLLCGRLDAFACGQLVALAEHRAAVKARLWDLNPFIQESGSSLRGPRITSLKERLQTLLLEGHDDDDDNDDEDDPNVNLSTKTILRHYSNIMRGQRTTGGK